MTVIYADNNATTQVAPEVLEAMTPFFGPLYFNPSSAYQAARSTAAAIAAARQTIAQAFSAGEPDQIIFTSGATESNNAAIFGAVKANPQRRHIVTTGVEHPAVLEVAKVLKQEGCEVTFLGVNRRGELDLQEYIRALRPETLLVTIMHANNETGVIFPVAELARIAKETDPGILFHTDATQSAGKVPLKLDAELAHVDMLSFSGHKLHAPKGIGALFVRRGTPLRPFLIGGHQENNRRAGTQNVPYIAGLAKAVEIAIANQEQNEVYIRGLRDRLERSLLECIPAIEVNGQGTERLVNTLNVSCHSVEGEAMLEQLNALGICASSGSACTSGSLEPSHVLQAMHIPFSALHGSIRFSLSRYTTPADIDEIIRAFPKVVANLRRISPYWDAAADTPRAVPELH